MGDHKSAQRLLEAAWKAKQAEINRRRAADQEPYDREKVAEAMVCAADMEVYAGKGEDVVDQPAIDPDKPLDTDLDMTGLKTA